MVTCPVCFHTVDLDFHRFCPYCGCDLDDEDGGDDDDLDDREDDDDDDDP